jgi:hypothetical protein
VPRERDAFTRLRPWLRRSFLGALTLLAVAWWQKGSLVGPDGVRPELLAMPNQSSTERAPFAFAYRSRQCLVRPVASYDVWGLVVSHNDIGSVADIYHDASSVDTKDLCLLWGESLRHPDYLRARFHSGPFTCYASWSEPLANLHLDGIGNNHLITDSPAVRRAIDGVRIGDQVRLRGLLVDYQMDDWRDFWRRTSTVRDDRDCEVLFVEDLAVIRRGTPGWYLLWQLAIAVLLTVPILYGVLFWLTAGRDPVKLGQL